MSLSTRGQLDLVTRDALPGEVQGFSTSLRTSATRLEPLGGPGERGATLREAAHGGRRRESGRARRPRREWPRRRRRRSSRTTASPPRRAPRRGPSSRPGRRSRATWTFVRFGKRSCVSSSGPIRGSSSGSPITTACGLPTSTTMTSSPAICSGSATVTAPSSCSTSPFLTRATVSRGPTRMRTSAAPVRSASQRAAMRVPFPESSAVEPSGFQITTSASSPPQRRSR